MKTYPIDSAVREEAREYADKSMRYTSNHPGWKDEHKKPQRIFTGRCAQLWVAAFCEAHGVPCEKDQSSHKVEDDFDVLIIGQRVDVKATIFRDLVGQVTVPSYNKPGDYYCFAIIDEQCTAISPYGFVSKKDYEAHAFLVPEGELIKATNTWQRFKKGSYFLPDDCPAVTPFEATLFRWRDQERYLAGNRAFAALLREAA
jgi:hypothetical protein